MNLSLNNNNHAPDYRFKIILVGNSVVGKTSLMASYIDNNFQLNTVPTLGVDFKVRVDS
jgi:Ras-related protein Rab-11A/Ras-related protein Rab-11B